MAKKNPDLYHVTVALPRTVQKALRAERGRRLASEKENAEQTIAEIASEWLTSKALESQPLPGTEPQE